MRSSKLKERRYSSSNSSSFDSLSSDCLRMAGGLVMLKYCTISCHKTSGVGVLQAEVGGLDVRVVDEFLGGSFEDSASVLKHIAVVDDGQDRSCVLF